MCNWTRAAWADAVRRALSLSPAAPKRRGGRGMHVMPWLCFAALLPASMATVAEPAPSARTSPMVPPYLDACLGDAERAADLVSRLSLAEKVVLRWR